MWKKIAARAVLGFPIGVFVGYTVTVIISAVVGHGVYYPVVPGLEAFTGGEMSAVWLQFLMSGLLGAIYGAASLIWGVEKWSHMRKSAIHFVISTVAMFPVAYLTHWMPHTVGGILQYIGIFVGLYAVTWLVTYLVMRKDVDEINARIKKK